eukprot:4181658-Pyramimonas_sp.AAC.1
MLPLWGLCSYPASRNATACRGDRGCYEGARGVTVGSSRCGGCARTPPPGTPPPAKGTGGVMRGPGVLQ